MKICKCGMSHSNKHSRCNSCHNEYMKKYLRKRYHSRREEVIQLLGGKCQDCGSIDDLEIDHKDPKYKDYNIGKILHGSWSKIYMELALCTLRCTKCHKTKTISEKSVEHGGGISGKKNCLCILCKAKKAQYMKNRY